jgi:hypothetical protein
MSSPEHLVRYRAILHKAGEDIHDLTSAMVGLCSKPAPPGEGTFNLVSVLVTGIVAVTTTVITGGSGTTVGVLLGAAVVELIGEAIKTAEGPDAQNKAQLENHEFLRDTARQYIAVVDKIERDTGEAIQNLRDSLSRELDALRSERKYEVVPTSDQISGDVPYVRDYL